MLRALRNRAREARFLANPTVRIGTSSHRLPRFHPLGFTIDEPWMVDLLRSLLAHKQGVFIDIGVNVGQPLLCAKTVDPQLPYVGFDPNPRCIAYVEEIVERNGFVDVVLLCAGVGETTGMSVLEFYSANPRDSSASVAGRRRPGETVRARKAVTMITFDDVLRMLGERVPGIVKIDVEGGEAAIFKSLEPHLSLVRPWVVFEVLPAYDESFTDRIAAQELVQDILTRASYKLYRVAKTTNGGWSGVKAIEDFGLHGNLADCDYLAVPLEDGPSLASMSAMAV